MGTKILFCGAHSVGKSTMALEYASKLKLEDRSRSVYLIQENVRAINKLVSMEMNSEKFQKMLILDAINHELNVENDYSHVVCDRSTIDSIIYSMVNNVVLPKEYIQLGLEHLKTFDIINFIRPSTDVMLNDGFRNLDIEYRNKIDKAFKEILDVNNIKYELKNGKK